MKSLTYLMIFTPFLINLTIIILIMIPSKMNVFHPLLNMIILIFFTFLTCLKMNFIYHSWLSFILFLTMIGGLMIIFMYIISLINNNFFYLNIKIIKMNFIKMFLMMMMMIFIYYYLSKFMIFYEINLINLFNQNLMIYDQKNMNLLYKKFFNKSTMFIMMYLYYTMIIIMNICSIHKSPLRQNLFYE